MNCHICNEDSVLFIHEKTNITYYHCKSCEYIFKSPEYYQDFIAQKERYDLHKNYEEDAGYRAYFQRFLEFVLPNLGEVQTALDFGCGRTSLLAKLLEEEGMRCDYYDPIYHPYTLDNRKKYDLIVSTEVFEHLHHPKKVFKSLVDRLKEGGYLAIQTEFHPNTIEAFKEWYYHQDPTHIVFYTEKSFKVLAEMHNSNFCASNQKNIIILRKNF